MRVFRGGLAGLPRILSSAASFDGGPLQWINLAVDRLGQWRRRHRLRRQLQSMSNHMRRDIGISSTDVLREASKPFWKP